MTTISIPYASISDAASADNIDSIHQQLDYKIPYGYINKTVCGCGLTSYAIEHESDNIIIALPNVATIKNKTLQYPNDRYPHFILGIYKGTTYHDITKYITYCQENSLKFKILTTYDSLVTNPILKKIITNHNPHIIIDESHQLFSIAQLKIEGKENPKHTDIIQLILRNFSSYEKITFMSATPIPQRFFLSNYDWVEHLPLTKIQWSNTKLLTPILIKQPHPLDYLRNKIIKPLKEQGEITINQLTIKKVIIYLNSTSSINKIIKDYKLTDDYDLIVSEKSSTLKPTNYDPYNLKTFTFITSAGFCGLDLYDPQAISIVVSYYNEHNKNLMLDLNTDLIQCISRQRSIESPLNHHFLLIYNFWAGATTEEQYKAKIKEEIYERITQITELLNYLHTNNPTLENHLYQLLKESETFRLYTNYNSEKWSLNQLMYDIERYKIARIQMTYKQDSTIFQDLKDEGKINSPIELVEQSVEPINITTTETPKEKKYTSAILLKSAKDTQEMSESPNLPIEKTQLPTALHPLYDAITYALKGRITIATRDITHPKDFIEKITKHQNSQLHITI